MDGANLSGKAVGQPIRRVDGIAKVTGRARYAGDIELPGMLVGRCLRSPYPSARITAIDTSKAKALPGVRAVLTGADVPDTRYGRMCKDIPVLAKSVVRFVGEKVVAVAADTGEIAEAALELTEPVRATAVEAALLGNAVDETVFRDAALVLDAIDPIADFRGSIDYKRKMAVVHVRRAVVEAASKAMPSLKLLSAYDLALGCGPML
jgi:xanthine dehydrogenase molybdopterin-binding subunit B